MLVNHKSCQCRRTKNRNVFPLLISKALSPCASSQGVLLCVGGKIAEFLPTLTLLPHPALLSITVFTLSVVKTA